MYKSSGLVEKPEIRFSTAVVCSLVIIVCLVEGNMRVIYSSSDRFRLAEMFGKLDAFGVQDCGLTGDSVSPHIAHNR